MSLINEALKRAQEVQTRELPKGPMLRPAEPEHKAAKRAGLLLPSALVVVALGVLFVLWKFAAERSDSPPLEQPKAVRPLAANPPQVAPPTAVAVTPVHAPVSEPELEPERVPVPQTQAPVVAPARATPPISVPAVVKSEPAQLPLVIQAPQPIPGLKLQSILFSKNPSAMISGIIVREGDPYGDYVVRSIVANKVELVSVNETNVLTLR